MRPFLTVVTRTMPGREKQLNLLERSLCKLPDKYGSIEHVIIHDNERRGLYSANCSFYENREKVSGEWVVLIDDDDILLDADLTKELQARDSFGVVMAKVVIRGRVVPTTVSWMREPVRSNVSGSGIIMRNEIFMRHIEAFRRPRAADYYFIKEVFSFNYPTSWYDNVIIYCTKHGRP